MLDMMIKLRYAFLYAKLNNSKQDLSISYINFRGPDEVQKKDKNSRTGKLIREER